MGAANQMSCWIAGGFDISIIREKTPQRFVGISLEKMVSFIAFRIMTSWHDSDYIYSNILWW